MAVTFDSSRKAAGVTLSGGDLTATRGASDGGVGTTATFNASGQYYCEITCNADGSSNELRIGLCNSTFDPSATTLGNDTNSYGWRTSTGQWFVNGSVVGTNLATLTTGDVVSIMYDADANTVAFWKNGVSAGETKSLADVGLQPALHLAFASAAATINFGASAYTYTPPVGYDNWVTDPIGNGAVTLLPLFALGGGPPSGAVSLQALTAAGTGRALISTGAVSLSALTAAGTGGQESYAQVSLLALTAAGTGSAANNITAALTAPVPQLIVTGESGNVITVVARAPVPLLVATGVSPAVIAAALTAPVPRLVATGLAGTVGTAELTAIAPILAAAGYSAYTITASLLAPKLRLVARGVTAIAATYRTWVINARKSVPTEYTGWQFDSFAQFNGKVYAVSAAGLVELDTSTTDAGTAITGIVRTGANSFGTSLIKRVPRVYVGGQFKGDVTFRTITSEGGTRAYLLPYNHLTSVQQRRVPIGKGPKSVRWQFELEFADDDVIDNLIVYPTVLRRRVQ